MKTDIKKLFSDAVIISLCWFGSYYIRDFLSPVFGYEINPFINYVIAYPFILIFWIVTALYVGVYKKYGQKEINEIVRGFKAWMISFLISMSFAFLVRELNLSRSVLLIFSVICFILLTFKNYAFGEEELKKALIVGTGPLSIRVMQKIEDMGKYKIVGLISTSKEFVGKIIDNYEVKGTISSLKEIIKSENVDVVIFADEKLPLSAVMSIISNMDIKDVAFFIVSQGFEAVKYGLNVEFIGSLPLVELGFETKNPFYDVIKRIFDFVVSLILLLILIPVFIVIAIAIKIDSPGPVFFIQERVGKDGKIFKVIKFRTMYKDTPKFALSPRSQGDPRITKVGAFLRRWSLDELPQLINVLKGEMSLVGPRPEMPQIVAEYEPWQRERLKVKPGITGIWQILGRKDLPLEKNIQYDLIYVKNRSFLLDIIIILKTIPLVIKGKGAY
jgi:exopolysaccharide biosynthesis polyprenyl glycosylphosphotransferase